MLVNNIYKIFLKKIKSILNSILVTISKKSSVHKRHKSIYTNGELIVNKLTTSERKEYLSYWRKLSPFVSMETVEISKSLSGKYDKFIVPEEFFHHKIECELNSHPEVAFLKNKSIYNKWFNGDYFPLDYFHCMEGVFYDGKHNIIKNIDSFIKESNINYPVVFKPNFDSYGGKGVEFVSDEHKLRELMLISNNYVVQEKIFQSEILNTINTSVNTVRVCLYRPSNCNSYHVINCSLRMGVDGSLDNLSSGGIVCNISDLGLMNEYATNIKGIRFYYHPNSKFIFKNTIFPYYKELLDNSISVANQVPNTNLLSLDMCLDLDNSWRCIEFTMFGQTVSFAQHAGSSFFGKYTDDVMSRLVG